MFKLDLEKTEEQEIKFVGSLKKQENSRKKKMSASALLTIPKPLCGSQQTVQNSRGENSRPP